MGTLIKIKGVDFSGIKMDYIGEDKVYGLGFPFEIGNFNTTEPYTQVNNNTYQYWHSQLIHKDRLPVGSTIEVAAGYTMRPYKFSLDSLKGIRLSTVDGPATFTIDVNFYNTFPLMGFHVSKTTSGRGLTKEEAEAVIKLIPL